MASQPPLGRLPAVAQAGAPQCSGRADNPAVSRRAAGWLFAGYILLLLVEYAGLAAIIPPLKTIRFSTILSYSLFLGVIATAAVPGLLRVRQTKLLLAFVVLTALSVVWAVVQWYAVQQIRPLVDYMVLFTLTVAVIDRQRRADVLSWLFLLVTAFLVLRNVDKLMSAERTGAFNAPYFMGDGNDLAWGLVVMLPFILNLALGPRPVVTRLLAVTAICLSIFGVIGSGSRGAALGLAASLFYYWLVMSRRKVLGVVALAVVAAGVLVFAPPRYFERLHTIAEYQDDSSAQARLQVWGASLRMAVDYPLGVGAGNFSSAYGRYYLPSGLDNRITWAPRRWLGAHSIYFKVLGEYGLLGLLLLLAVIRRNLKDALAARRALMQQRSLAAFRADWPALLNMSIVGYAVCGVFLGGITYPHLFLLSALVVAVQRSLAPAPAASGAAGARG